MAYGEIITGFEPDEEEDDTIAGFEPIDTDIISDFEPVDTGVISDFTPTEKPVDRPVFEMTEAPLKAKYPNLYGAWGVAKTLVPYIKYIDPDERERFAELSTQKQTRELLLQNLETIAMLGTAGVSAGVKPVVKAAMMKWLPKTYKFLTKPLGKVGVEKLVKAKHPVEKMYERTDVELEQLRKPSVAGAYHALKRATIDVSGNIKKALLKKGGQSGKEAVIRHDLIRGAGPKAERLVNEASGRIYNKLSKAEETTLNRIIQSRRTIAIDSYKPGMKHPEGLGATEHQAFLDSLPREQLAKLNQRADVYFSEMKTQLDLLKESSLITDESYKSLLKAGDYSPRQFLQPSFFCS